MDSGREERFGRNVVTSHDRACGRPQTSYKHQIVIPVRFLEGLRCIKKLMLCIAGKKQTDKPPGRGSHGQKPKEAGCFCKCIAPATARFIYARLFIGHPKFMVVLIHKLCD